MVTPELALSGYPPEDLLFHRGFRRRIDEALARLADAARGIDLLVGYPEYSGGVLFNAAAWLRDGRKIANYRKRSLPNYQVFDEKRYFTPGDAAVVVEFGGIRIAPLICEDVWHVEPAAAAAKAGAAFAIALNASPYEQGKQAGREENMALRAKETGLAFAYLNLVGGQDELVFDGSSFVIDAGGQVVHRLPAFEEISPCSTSSLRATASAFRAARSRGFRSARKASGARSSSASATTSASTASRASCSAFRAASTPRSCSRSPAMRSGSAARARGDDALAAHVGHVGRGRGRDGERARRALLGDPDRGHVPGDASPRSRRSSRAASPTRPRRTSRRAAAACC